MAKWKERLKNDKSLRRYKARQFRKIISEVAPITEFETDLYNALIEKLIVFDGRKIIVRLLDGTEVECLIE